MNAELREAVLRLSPAERWNLAIELWESLEPDDYPPLSQELKDELGRRLAESEANPDDGVTWEELESQIRNR